MRKYLEANIEHNTLNMPKETWLFRSKYRT